MRAHRLAVAIALGCLAAAGLTAPPRPGFPGYGLLPKEDTGALRFLERYPDYDGRGVLVAIFDTGVDPGAPGLQVTTDGKPKIVDLIDGSGDGDVDTSTVAEAVEGKLAGRTGRTLVVPAGWTNPSGKFHVGMKAAYELYPDELVSRLKRERLDDWLTRQRAAETELERALAEWDAAHPEPTQAELDWRAERKVRLEQLRRLQEQYEDSGPVFDCVVFHDGQTYRAVVDTDEDGDLADETLLASFREERAHATFGPKDLLNFALNVYDHGNRLSIVTDSGSHGTHVAGIVAAHYPDQPELNGLAPGAQLISVKIGDARLGSSSAGTGEVRGCIAVIQHGCDLINMSFGGPTSSPNDGRTMEIYGEVVHKHGVIFCASAGNEGPALSTAGSPGATTEALLGIGAYITPDMQEMQYSLPQTWSPGNYTFTSRGPTYDGALGASVVAPGGAIAPVPNWVLQRNAQMHGTSMASPSACGSLALLLSGLKAEGIPYSPARVRRAIENTATAVPGMTPFAQGHGLLQIDRAFEALKERAAYDARGVRFEVRLADGSRGVYLREPYEVERVHDVRVRIEPQFHEDADNRAKVAFEVRCRLETTARWIECAEHLLLMHNGRHLDIRVDPTRLPPGAHYAEVRGYDAADPAAGPIFRVPVTVIRPEPPVAGPEFTWAAQVPFEPGYEERHFLVVPEGATWADVRVQRTDDGTENAVVVLQMVQLAPGYGYHEHEYKQYLRLRPADEHRGTAAVLGGRTLEICLAEYSTYVSRGTLEVEVEFHGLALVPAAVGLDGGELYTRLDVAATLRKEKLAPRGELTTWRRTVRPESAVLRPLDGLRDKLPEQKQVYELVTTYAFTMDEAGEVTPHVALSRDVDEKTWQSRMWMIFDAAKRRIATGALDPGAVKLEKGSYTLRYQVRLDDPETLGKLEDVVLNLDQALDSAVALSFYEDPDEVALEGRKFGGATLAPGAQTMIYVATPRSGALPKGPQPGDALLGSATFGAAGDRPGGYPAAFRVPPKPQEQPAPEGKAEEEKKPAAEAYAEALRAWQVERLATLRAEQEWAQFDTVAAEILAEQPGHLPVLVEQLRKAEAQRDEDLPGVVAAAERVLVAIDAAALAAYFGTKHEEDDPAAARRRAELESQRKHLVEALHLKARALLDLARQDAPADDAVSPAADDDGPFEAAFRALAQWVDTTEAPYRTLHVERQMERREYGAALKVLTDALEKERTDRALIERRIEVLEALGWDGWVAYERTWNLIRFPETYPLF